MVVNAQWMRLGSLLASQIVSHKPYLTNLPYMRPIRLSGKGI